MAPGCFARGAAARSCAGVSDWSIDVWDCRRSQAGWGLLHSRHPHAEWSLAALACAHGPRVAMRSADRAVHQLCTYWEEALNASGLQVGTWI